MILECIHLDLIYFHILIIAQKEGKNGRNVMYDKQYDLYLIAKIVF